ncbi:hypothetical protein [Actinomadura sp. 7K534]|uniref:hypothetical protein n=1 Tax=Actinomadura sp. 7K534 TaxID=2530366 RepID=UPI00104B2FC1|nr:hypothetical protein [Actinomadura sp. 7K534]TDB96613.1 hypothetical protein E1266_09350 [Actinomadura sp. 7K534]
MTAPTLILRKTRTAADYVRTRTRNAETRERAAAVLHVLAGVHAAGDVAAPASLRDLVAAVGDCAGPEWLQAHADDPDVRRLATLLDAPDLIPGDPEELDELLATVLWTRHGPQPATA